MNAGAHVCFLIVGGFYSGNASLSSHLSLLPPHHLQLHILLLALATSIVPVMYSFILLFIVTSIYAIICSEMFGDKSEEGFAYFGNFTRSLFSLFQARLRGMCGEGG